MQTKLKGGQIALTAVVFFLFISLVVLGSFGALGISQLSSANEFLRGKRVLATADSGIEDAGYRIIKGKQPAPITSPTSITASLNSGSTLVAISYDSVTGTYTLASSGRIAGSDSALRYRNVSSKFKTLSEKGLGFEAALQAGYLGVIMQDSASLQHVNEGGGEHGNLISNGTVNATEIGNQDFVSGNVTVARPIANDVNYAQVSPRASPDFGAIPLKLGDLADNSHDFSAQSFIAPITASVVRVDFYVQNVGTAGDMRVKIVKNVQGQDKPSSAGTDVLAQRNILSGAIPPGPAWIPESLSFMTKQSNDPIATENQKYWIVFDASAAGYSTTKYYMIGEGDGTYTRGRDINGIKNTCYGDAWCNVVTDGDATFKYATTFTSTSIWTGQGKVMAFYVYFGEFTDRNGTGSTRTTKAAGLNNASKPIFGDVEAETIRNTVVADDAYYKYIEGTVTAYNNPGPAETCTSSGGTKCHNASIIDDPHPMFIGCPWWQKCFDDYKTIAAAGGSSGSVTITSAAPPLGPKLISGNLTVGNNGDLTIGGTSNDTAVIYVTGNGVFDGNPCTIRLTEAGKSGFIIFEGTVTVARQCRFVVPQGSSGDIYIFSKYFDPAAPNPGNTITVRDQVNSSVPLSGGPYDTTGAFFAPVGQIQLMNNATVASAIAARIIFINTAQIKYKTGIQDTACPGDCGIIANVTKFSEYHEIE